jgi:glutathione synthase
MANIALQMDPLPGINARGDSTLRIGLEAQRRGHTLFYYTPDRLSDRDGILTARGHRVALFDNAAHYFELKDELTLKLRDMDVVLLRQDPPFNMTYLTTTYLLETLPASTLVVNDPASVRNHPEKLFPGLLRRYMPETLISADMHEIERFLADHGDIVMKPLYGYGGRSVLRFTRDDANFYSALEMVFAESREPWMFQRFLPEVKDADVRIVFMDGKVEGVLGRIPAAGQIRANMRAGGTPALSQLSPNQQDVCEALGPMLTSKGILFAGVDMIADYLTEINITSPTGLAQIHALYGTRPEEKLWDAIEARLSART